MSTHVIILVSYFLFYSHSCGMYIYAFILSECEKIYHTYQGGKFMLWKFLKHILCGILENIKLHFKVGFVCFLAACVLALALLPFACLLGTAPMWIFWVELGALIVFLVYRSYKKFAKENSEENS